MSENAKEQSIPYGLTWTQKITYLAAPLVLSILILLYGQLFTGVAGTILFIVLGVLLGLVTFFISAGWTYKLEIGNGGIRVNDRRDPIVIPLDRIGMVVRNGGFPFPTLWLVLRNWEKGQEIPGKGVDPHARALIEAYQKRNPGKKITYFPVPGGYLKSVEGFARELKQRIPPLTVDERLGVK